jgi:hypothetical protein
MIGHWTAKTIAVWRSLISGNRKWNRTPLPILIVALSLTIISLIDYYLKIASPELIVVAVLDEMAHLATAIIFIAGLRRFSDTWFVSACLAGAVLIDVDHLPAMLSPDTPAIQAERPVTHSIVWVAALIIVSLWTTGRGRALLTGFSLGIVTHLVRDMATGGVPLFWPVHGEIIEIAYWTYAVLMIAIASLVAARWLVMRISFNASPNLLKDGTSHRTGSRSHRVSDR